MNRWLCSLFLGCLAMSIISNPVSADAETTERARQLVISYQNTLRPLDIAANRAWWDANMTGKDEDFKKKEEAQNKIDAVLSDPKAFTDVRALRGSAAIDPSSSPSRPSCCRRS